MIMQDVYNDPEYMKIFEEFNELTEQTQQIKEMMGSKAFDELENRQKLQDMLDL